MKLVGTERLTVAQDLDSFPPLLDEMVDRPMPGFQVDPAIGPLAVIKENLAAAMQDRLPEFRFNRTFSSVPGLFMRDFARHMDADLYGTGIALHVCQGVGFVSLRLARAGVAEDHYGLFHSLLMTGPRYVGELKDTTLTVFSVGIDTDDFQLGTAFHKFRTRIGDPRRTWRRHSYDPSRIWH